MSLSSKLIKDIQFLYDLDSKLHSIGKEGDNLKTVNKRSRFWNLFWGVIHFVTLGFVARNKELDHITCEILKELGNELANVTISEKDLAEKSIRNLQEVIQHNGGSEAKAVSQMLATIAKIRILPAVKKLQNPEPFESPNEQTKKDEVVAPPDSPKTGKTATSPSSPKLDDTASNSQQLDKPTTSFSEISVRKTDDETLQRLLQDLLRRKAADWDELEKLLLILESTVILSDKELALLESAWPYMSLRDGKQRISPNLLTGIVKSCLQTSQLFCLNQIIRYVRQRGLDKELTAAFASGFENCHTSTFDDARFTDCMLYISSVIDSFLITSLSAYEKSMFLKDLSELTCRHIQANPGSKSLAWLLHLMGKIRPDDEKMMLQILCQLKEPKLLAEIISAAANKTYAFETILKNNPHNPTDPTDLFFQQFVNDLKQPDITHLIQHASKSVPPTRQQILAAKFTPKLIVQNLKVIPTTMIGSLDDKTFLEVATEVERSEFHNPDIDRLKAFAKTLSVDKLLLLEADSQQRRLAINLLPLCDEKIQVEFVSRNLHPYTFENGQVLDKVQVPLTVWIEASRQNPVLKLNTVWRFDTKPMVAANMVNGQIGNPGFLREFFEELFNDLFKLDLPMSVKHKLYLAHLTPGVFVFDKPEEIKHTKWYRFFKALREMTDQKKAKDLLLEATRNLFNSPGFRFVHVECLYAMTREQLELLPIASFTKPEIRLLLAALTDRLDDSLIADANSFYDNKNIDFFNYFDQAYTYYGTDDETILEQVYGFVFKKDIEYLKKFLLWILDRPSITPVLPAWNYINERHAKETLLRAEIQNDSEIQGHIKRLNLKIYRK